MFYYIIVYVCDTKYRTNRISEKVIELLLSN